MRRPNIATALALALAPSPDYLLADQTIREALALADSPISMASLRANVWSAAVKGGAVQAVPIRPNGLRLFGSSVKVRKGERQGVATMILYLTPGRLCPNATAGCLAACLGHRAGMMVTPSVRASQRWKSAALASDPVAFVALLIREARSHVRASNRARMIPALRVDGSSDTGIGQQLARCGAAPGARWYDYTKSTARAHDAAHVRADERRRKVRRSYSLTFSHSGENAAECRSVLRAGGAVAVVFAQRPGNGFPATFGGSHVLDGDRSDARFLDRLAARGAIVGLSLKNGRGSFADIVRDAGSFAVDPSVDRFAE